MKLVNTGTQGKHAVVGGRISRTEIQAVIPVIERILLQCKIGLDAPVADSLLGSSGSERLMCGDIDIAVPIEALNRGQAVSAHEDVLSCSQHGNVISFVIAIPNGEISENQLRNGLVQVDLIGGDFQWLKQFYHSDSRSAFKGAHRNLLISAYLSHFRKYTYIKEWGSLWNTDEGPIFSQKNGLFNRKRERVVKGDGTPYASKFIITATDNCFDLEKSALYYFGSCYATAFSSFENLVCAIEENYDPEYVAGVYTRFFDEYLVNLPHLKTDDFPWARYPMMNAARLKNHNK